MQNSEKDQMYLMMYLTSTLILLVNVYYFGYEVLYNFHCTWGALDGAIGEVVRSGMLRRPLGSKALIAFIVFATYIIKAGKPIEDSWKKLIMMTVLAAALFFFPYLNATQYVLTTLAGYAFLSVSVARLGRKINGFRRADNDPLETFDQCQEKIETDMSVNIPTKYQWKHTMHRGWINVVQPQRATLVMGVPGSGKSFAVYNPFIEQMIAKAFPMFVYDYKYPDLTEKVYNEYLLHKDAYVRRWGKEPQFCILNFNDPRESMRCNPLSPKYLNDPADTAEVADIIFRNVNPQSIEKDDFFTMSAKVYIDALIWFLRIHGKPAGKYCTFPHLIELMCCPYQQVFKMLMQHEEIRVKLVPFKSALEGKAMEQLMGQIASAQIPLLRFASPALYWVLSGDDFPLNFNDPDNPAIICMGNDPDRQSIYGTTLALYTSRMFKEINHKTNRAGKKNLPCGVLLDELPTIFIKGLDNLIATARSNKVCIVIGAQDESQLIRDYTQKEADVIMNTIGNVFVGQVNGRTAEKYAKTFGREFREQQSQTTGGQNDTINTSYQQQEILPQSRIESLSQGYFFGKVADDFEHPIKKKLFCAQIQIDVKGNKEREKAWKPLPKGGAKYFDLENTEKEVRQNPVLVQEYMYNRLKQEQDDQAARDFSYSPDTRIVLRQKVVDKWKSLSDEDREHLIDEVINFRQTEVMQQVLDGNYRQIQLDVKEIFDVEKVSMTVEDEKEGAAENEEQPERNSDVDQDMNVF